MRPILSFKYQDEYRSDKLGNCFIFFSTNSFTREQLSDTGTINNIHYGDIHTKYPSVLNLKIESVPYLRDDILLKNYELCRDYDLIIADASEDYADIGKSIQLINVSDKVVSGLHTLMLRPKNQTLYYTWLMQTWSVKHQIMRFAVGTKVLGISKEELKKVLLFLPNIEEQNKIATFLNLYYKKIELQKKKINLLSQIKKERINKVFNDSQYFNNVKLKACITQISERNVHDMEAPVLSVNNKMGFVLQSEQFKEEVASDNKSSYKIIKKNQFAYNPARINVGSIALLIDKPIGIISPMYVCFKRKDILMNEFLNYYLLSSKFKHEMFKRLEGSVRMCLSYESLCNIPISLPETNQQYQLCLSLNLLDKKIELERYKLLLLEQYKKGLLQQMFI